MFRTAAHRLTILLTVAFAVSVVHYVDNTMNYEAYPVSSSIPNPSQGLVGFSWFLFTAFGIAGYVLFRRGEIRRAALLLSVYSGSGLVGIGHYTVPGATDLVWWRQAHIVADILCGVAILAFAVWSVRTLRDAEVGTASG